MIDLRPLFVVPILSVESRSGQMTIWVHTARGRFPLANWSDLELPAGLDPASWWIPNFSLCREEIDYPSNN